MFTKAAPEEQLERHQTWLPGLKERRGWMAEVIE
jgi:hypothetical protein